MRFYFILVFSILTSCIFAQEDNNPIEFFKSYKFPCDTETTTLEINICLGNKLEFADSLLNVTFRKIINDLDKDINEDKSKMNVLRSKKVLSAEEKKMSKYYAENIEQHQKIRQAIIKSQREWIKLRDSNEEVTRIMCEGGTGCNGI